MCGRYALSLDVPSLQQQFQQDNVQAATETVNASNWQPSYNIAPTRTAPVYFLSHEQNNVPILQFMTWGLIPPWTKSRADLKKAHYSTFNARIESVQEGNRLWKSMRDGKRAVVPIQGYYEWRKIEDASGKVIKVPYFITRNDGKLIYLAGFWNKVYWQDETTEVGDGQNIYSFTVITGPATNELHILHPRIPLFLEPGTKEWELWLGEGKWSDKVAGCLNVCGDGVLKWYEVSKDAGKTSIDKEYLTKPLSEKKGAIHEFFSNGSAERDLKKDALKKETADDNSIKKELAKLTAVDDQCIKKESLNIENDTNQQAKRAVTQNKSSDKSQRKRSVPDQPSIFEYASKKTKRNEESYSIGNRVHSEYH